MPRILMIGPSPDGFGGISRVVKLWKENGIFDEHSVRYISSVSDAARSKIAWTLRSLISFLYFLFRHNSIVYIHSASHRSFFRKSIFLLPAILMRKSVFLHIHPDLFIDFLKSLSSLPKAWTLFLLRRVSGFVVITNSMREKMRLLFPDSSVWVIRNPVNIDHMQNSYGIRRKNDRILFLGWFIPEKGVYELVDAVGMLVESGRYVQLDFYGTKEANRLKEYITKKELTHAVNVHGWIGHEEKVRTLYKSTMLVLPSYTEGVPNVILEAMATRTPIVATHVGGLREVLRNNENALIVRVKDSVDLSTKIAILLDNAILREKIAENAFLDAKRKHDIETIKRTFASMIHEI